MPDLKFYVYVWRGKGVLEAYGPGLVVVIAESEMQAWAKLKAQQFGVFANLWCGGPSWFEEQCELDQWIEELKESEEGIADPITPVQFELEQAPVLHQRGTD
jgi:hypothetical protein